jgi:TFIIF-interacting CTD phosphatase-like protein
LCNDYLINILTRIDFFPYHDRTITSIRQQRRPILLVDMDETLIHCFKNAESERLCIGFGQYTNDEILRFSLPGDTESGGRERRYTVVKRPGAIKLMHDLRRHYEIHVWTAAVKAYADKVLDWLEEEQGPLFQSRGYRTDCTPVPTSDGGMGYLKNIAAKFGENNLGRVLLLDNNPDSSPDDEVSNSVPVTDFFGDKNDDEFLVDTTYKQLLIQASKLRDVRNGITDEFRLLIHNRRSRERVSE